MSMRIIIQMETAILAIAHATHVPFHSLFIGYSSHLIADCIKLPESPPDYLPDLLRPTIAIAALETFYVFVVEVNGDFAKRFVGARWHHVILPLPTSHNKTMSPNKILNVSIVSPFIGVFPTKPNLILGWRVEED